MLGAIIGGTGVEGLEYGGGMEKISTPYGEVTVDIIDYKGSQIAFLARHGRNHAEPPHKINYRANLWAMQAIGVKYVLATCAVGSCNRNLRPGEMVILKDFIDFTRCRPATFFDGQDGVIHVSMADPYCRNLRNNLVKFAAQADVPIKGEAVYVCTEGPRLETAAEIKMYHMLGGDVVGMTDVPEVVLAKELKICYAAVGIITNWCTGFGAESGQEEILAAVAKNKSLLTELYMDILATAGLDQEHCQCRTSEIRL